jgi:hypothetical protein
LLLDLRAQLVLQDLFPSLRTAATDVAASAYDQKQSFEPIRSASWPEADGLLLNEPVGAPGSDRQVELWKRQALGLR